MEAINIPELKIEQEAGNRTVFVIEPFYPGYGVTIGNALRRVLLSSLPGVAATAFKIVDGPTHEFSTIEGVKEDLVEVMLNLKGLRFIMHEEGPVKVTLKSGKGGEVTGKNISLPSSIELTNPEHHIATITGSNVLEMDIYLERGRGYRVSDEVEGQDFPVGTIAIDAVFSPIKRCSIQVENTRIGERVDYDKLTLEVETDGTITAKEALKQASTILQEQLTAFGSQAIEQLSVKVSPEPEVEVPTEPAQTKSDPKQFTIDEINLSVRTTNALVQNNIKKVKDILSTGREGLMEMKGVGERAVTEIIDKMEELGLDF